MFETILYSVENKPHATISLNRPEVSNGLTFNVSGNFAAAPWKMQKKTRVNSLFYHGRENLFSWWSLGEMKHHMIDTVDISLFNARMIITISKKIKQYAQNTDLL